MHHLWNKSICDKQFIHSIQCNHSQSCNSICSCRRHYYHDCSSKRIKLFQQRQRRPHQSFDANSRISSSSNRSSSNDISSSTLSQSRHHSVNTSHSERILCTRQQRIRRIHFKFMRSTFGKKASAPSTTVALTSIHKHQHRAISLSTYSCRSQCNTLIS